MGDPQSFKAFTNQCLAVWGVRRTAATGRFIEENQKQTSAQLTVLQEVGPIFASMTGSRR
jgi:hypothetical protein